MIFHKYKTIFIHIPKAGGTSIENLLWPDISTRTADSLWMGFIKPDFNKYQTGGLQHLLAKQAREEVSVDTFDSYYKFAIVRNPWDKVVSQFCYMQRRKDLRNFIGLKKSDSFEKYLSLIQKKEHVQWAKQVDFIFDDNKNLLVDDIFKLENLNDEIEKLSSKIGFEIVRLPHNNKGERKAYAHYYTDKTREIVSELYKDDIEYFKHEF